MAWCFKAKSDVSEVKIEFSAVHLDENGDCHEQESFPTRKCSTLRIKQWLRTNLLLLLTVVGIIAGFVVGLTVRKADPSPTALMWIGLPGDVFMRLLKMLILPLIVCSVISGMATLDPRSNGKISVIAFVYIIVTNFIGSLLGVVFSFINVSEQSRDTATKIESDVLRPGDIFADLIRNIFPDNIIAATFSQVQTKYSREKRNGTNETTVVVVERSLEIVRGSNLLGLMVFCIFIAIATNKSGEKGKPLLDFFTSASEIFLILLRWVIWSTPIGVLSLIAASLAGINDLEGTIVKVGYFVLTVTCGVASHQLIVMPLILFLFVRKNPFPFLVSLARAWLIGLATTSPAVAIPEMLEAVEEKSQVDQRVSRFVIPFCVTLNANGGAIYISASIIFMATVSGTPLTSGDFVIILILTAVFALAIPPLPSASIVTLLVIIGSLNIPDKNIGLLFAVEWYLDRIRTTSNIVSNSFCAIITNELCKKNLNRLEKRLSRSKMAV